MHAAAIYGKTSARVRPGSCLTALLAFTAALGALGASIGPPAHAQSSYKLSILSIYSPAETNAQIRPLARHLSAALKAPVEPVIYSNNAQYEKALNSGEIDFGFENPPVYVKLNTHEAIAMALQGAEGDMYAGVIVTLSDSPIKTLSDLKYKRIAIVSHTSGGGFLSQKLTLLENGIDIAAEATLVEAVENKQENVLLSVHLDDADAGFVRESALHMTDNFIPSNRLRVLQRTALIPNWAFSIKKNLPDPVKKVVIEALSGLKKGDPVLTALRIDGLRPASDGEYNGVRKAFGIPTR
jgi:phosphonate transport system substrate-binding protein